MDILTMTFSRKMNRSSFFFLLLLIATFSPLRAQEATPPDTSAKVKEQLIPVTRFAAELPAAVSQLHNIQKNVITLQQITSLKDDLDSLFLRMDSTGRHLELRDTGQLEQKELENIIYLWQQEKEKLTRWQERIENNLDDLQKKKVATDRIVKLWSRSLAANGKDINKDNRKILQDFISRARHFSDTLNLKSHDLMKMLQAISNRQILINNKLSFLQADLEKKEKMLLSNKGPSFFRVLRGEAPGYVFLGDVRKNLAGNLPPLKNYLTNNRFKLLWIFLIFLFLFISLIYLNKNKDNEIFQEKENAYMAKAMILVSRPLWTSLFLALLSARFILTSAPHDLYIILYTLTLIPLFLLIPAMLDKKNRYYFYMVGFIFLFDNLSELFFYGYLINNLVLIILSLLLIATLVKHSRESMSLMIFPGKFFNSMITTFNYVTILLLSASIISTFFGYYFFQEFLVTAYIWIYFAIYLYNTANITVAGLFEFLLYGKWTEHYKSISKYRAFLVHKIILLLNVVTFLLWLYTIVALFGFREEAAAAIVAVWEFGFKAGTLDITIGNITLFIFSIWLSIQIARIVQTMLEEDILDKMDLERGVPQSISILVKYVLVIIGFFVAAGAAGMQLDNLAFIFGALGVGIGFGLQDIINNFISGLILLFERPIHIGDNISVGELEGVVRQIGIRSSIIQSYDRSEVVVPNSKLISNEVINWTLSNQMRRLEIQIGVAYGTDMDKAMKILEECARDHKEVLDNPPPYVWFKEFGDSSIEFRLLFFYPRFDGGQTVRSEVATAIVRAFRKNGITIPFPQVDVHIREAMKKLEARSTKKE
jgi:small-conductance mechanosensitive channel